MKTFLATVLRTNWLCLEVSLVVGCSGGPPEEMMVDPNARVPSISAPSVLAVSDQTKVVATGGAVPSEPPATCADTKLANAYKIGEAVGQSLVGAIWRAFGTCDKLETFIDRLLERLQKIAPGADSDRPRKHCRYAGAIDGVFVALDAIQEQCATQCFVNGDLVGTIEAKAYCDLAIDAGGDLDPVTWLRAPVGFCGFEFEIGCDSKFLSATTSYVNSSGSCEPYTRSPYLDIWDGIRLKSCDYSQHDDQSGL